jgi:hypothetical protein
MKTTTPTPEKSPREKIGWKYMLAGFFIVLSAGIVYFVGPRSHNPVLYGLIGNYLMAAGLVIYIAGRVLRWRGRSSRMKQEKS